MAEITTGTGRRVGTWRGLLGFLTLLAAALSLAVPLYLHLAGVPARQAPTVPARSGPLEALVQGCDGGDGAACDQLHDLADPGTDVEQFGATCGYRFDTDDHVGACDQAI